MIWLCSASLSVIEASWTIIYDRVRASAILRGSIFQFEIAGLVRRLERFVQRPRFLRSRLQREIHFLEAPLRVSIKAAPEERDQDPIELLALPKQHPIRTERLDNEAVLAIEDAREQKSPEPPELSPSVRDENRGAEGHALGSAWLDPHLKPRTLFRGSADEPDERIPSTLR